MAERTLTQKAKYSTTFIERGSFWFYGIGMLFYYQIVGGYLNTFLLLRGVDLGLKCLRAGLVNVYTPHARMLCRGALPCLTDAAPKDDLIRFRAAWGEHPQERYYSPLFTRDGRMTVNRKEER